MTDRDKVVKGLIDLRRYLEDKEWSDNRMDRQAAKVYWQTATDAIALLKEQKAVEPIKMQRMDDNFSFFVPYFLCGNCKHELIGKDVMFCSHCGRAVKWNE